ncbi:MAG: DUF4288 domain-containing protein [Ottowia sp.]
MTQDLKNKKYYFFVSILYRSSIDGESGESDLWEEQIIAIRAYSESEAHEKAMKFALSQEYSYFNENGENVRWEFHKIERIFFVESEKIEDGTEVFSRFLRASEALSLLTPFD